jgi:hypothetical protein
MLNQLTYTLPEKLETIFQSTIEEWQAQDKIRRLWNKDATLWTNEDEAKMVRAGLIFSGRN